MQTVSQTFNGRVQFNVLGSFFRLIANVNPVDIYFFLGASAVGQALQVDAGYWVQIGARELVPSDPKKTFDRVEIVTGASELVKFGYGFGHMGYDRTLVTFTQATSVANVAEATVGLAESNPVLANPNRREIVFRSLPTNAGNIALGNTGLAVATAAIVLAPGDMWKETDSAGAAWYSIADLAAQNLEILTA